MLNQKEPPKDNDAFTEENEDITNSNSNITKKVYDFFINFKKNIRENINDNNKQHTIIDALLTYFPLVGPIYIILTHKENSFLKSHTTNATYLHISFISVTFLLWLLENFPLVSHFLKLINFVPDMTNAFHYLNWALLLILTAQGIKKTIQNKEWKIPYIYEFIEHYRKKFNL